MRKIDWSVSYKGVSKTVSAATPESAVAKAWGTVPGTHRERFESEAAVPRWVSIWGIYRAVSERGSFIVGHVEHG